MRNEADIVTMNVSLPVPLKRFVDGKVSSGIYGSASEFVREAIREKLQREQDLQQAYQELAEKLREGLASGKPIMYDETYIAGKKKKLLARLGRDRGTK